jgi:hypothetical protein
MVIDLTDPFTIAVFVGCLVIGITGIIKFIHMALDNKFIINRALRLDADLELLQKQHKEEIATITKGHTEEKIKAIEQAMDIYDKKITTILNEYKQLTPPYKTTSDILCDIYVYGNKPKSKKNS